jgi:hypothetical protein
MSRTSSRRISMNSHVGGAGSGGAALRDRTIKLITIKYPNP